MKKTIILISALFFVIFSCKKQDTTENIKTTVYFPNTIDSYWKYERYDSLTSSIEPLTVSIIGDTLMSTDLYKIWKYEYSNKIEKLYVLQSNDSLIIYNSKIDRIDQLYLIPFELGNGWINPDYHSDTSYVSKIQSIMIKEKTYHNVVLIERTAYGLNDYLTEKIWIKPHVGLLKLERNHLILGPYKNETWKLIEYYIQ